MGIKNYLEETLRDAHHEHLASDNLLDLELYGYEIKRLIDLLEAVSNMTKSDFSPYGDRIEWRDVEEAYKKLEGGSDD